MQIELLETFLDLMETRSFNRTAERLNLTQSTISHRVNALEGSIGGKLFVRGKGGTVPTVAAVRFHDHARNLRQNWHEALRAVEAAGSYERSMRIGMQHDIAEICAGGFLKAAREEMPTTTIYLEADYSSQMNRDLGDGNLDLAVLYTPHYLPDLHYERVGDLVYVLVSTSAAAVSQIRQEDYIYANYSPAFDRLHRIALPQFSSARLATGRNLMLANILSALGGATYVTLATAEDLASRKIARRVVDAPEIRQPVYAATSVRTRHSHYHRRLVGFLSALLA